MSVIYYVSACGSDQNDGLTPEKPLQTLAHLANIGEPGDQMLFRRGDIWRAQKLFCRSGVTYGAYGEGENPRFFGSERNYAEASLWTESDRPDVWQCAFDSEWDVCHIVFDNGAAWSVRKQSLDDVTDDLDYFYDAGRKAVFLRSSGHPAKRFSAIELGQGSLWIVPYDCRNMVIRDLTFQYCNYAVLTYCDRVGDVQGLRIEHCDFSWIGGHEGEYAPGGVRDGNAITIWGSARHVAVDHCNFYQLFDTAFTTQCGASPNSEVIFEDITLSDCRIEKCHWSTEFWIHVKDDNGGQLGTMRNIRILNNHFIGTGEGWSADQRWNGGPLSSASHIQTFNGEECLHISDILIQGNVFERSAYDLVSFYWKNAMPRFEGNTYIQTKGRPFATINGEHYIFDDDVNEVISKFDNAATVRFADNAECNRKSGQSHGQFIG